MYVCINMYVKYPFLFTGEFVKEKSHWGTEVESLRKQMEQLSTLCKYIDKTSEEGK